MPENVFVSQVDSFDKTRAMIADFFQKGSYEEISRSIGIYSILCDPQHMLRDQNQLYRTVLDMLKDKITSEKGKASSSWVSSFPKRLSDAVTDNQPVLDEASRTVIVSRLNAYGQFRSLDEFYFWALDDRRLTLEQIIRLIEKTAEMNRG